MLIENLKKCRKCNLCNNQLPLLDNKDKCDIMWIGLSAKCVDDLERNIPLENNTNSGMIIEKIENKFKNICFYKTNLVKCLPLDDNKKIRYPSKKDMEFCIENLVFEIEYLNPKLIFVLGKKAYNFIIRYLKNDNIIYIEHPSYIYVYKRKYINDYVLKVSNIIKNKFK